MEVVVVHMHLKMNNKCVAVFESETALEESMSGFIVFFIFIFIEERYFKSHIHK